MVTRLLPKLVDGLHSELQALYIYVHVGGPNKVFVPFKDPPESES